MAGKGTDEVLATVGAAGGRRWIGILMLALLGVLVIYVAFANPPEIGWQVFLVVIGLGALVLADRQRRATLVTIELTETELRDSTGALIARVEDIRGLDRGMFAFKPSNGFLITTETPGPRAWAPGLWWRLGRRIGIGGVTPASQTKVMSEILSALLAQRG